MDVIDDLFVFLPSNVPSPSSHENVVSHYVTQLAKPIELNGKYEVALVEVYYPGLDPQLDPPPRVENMFIYTNIIEGSFVGHGFFPILQAIGFNQPSVESELSLMTFAEPDFIPVTKNHISEIEILFTDPEGKKVPFAPHRSQVTLYFRKVKDASY